MARSGTAICARMSTHARARSDDRAPTENEYRRSGFVHGRRCEPVFLRFHGRVPGPRELRLPEKTTSKIGPMVFRSVAGGGDLTASRPGGAPERGLTQA